jgi:tetratricopeptide (TPR) repeat protein
MVLGYTVLFVTDILLTLVGWWLLRSPRFGDSPPVSVTVLSTLGAMAAHILAYSSCQAIMAYSNGVASNATGERMGMFLVNMASGIVPAVIFGYLLVISTANTLSTQMAMMDKKPEPISTDAFKRARGFAAQSQFTAAIEECRRLAKRFPASPLPLIEIAMIQQRANRPEDAADTLRTVLRDFPLATEARHRAALLLADLMEYSFNDPETAAYLRNGMKKETPPPGESAKSVPQWIEMERARNLAEKGDIDRAVSGFREIFKRNPKAPRPLFEAATILEKVGRPDDSAGVLRALAHASPEGSEAWAEAMYRLARLLQLYFDDPDARLHALREILRKAPGSKAASMAQQALRDDADRLTDI